MPYIDSKDREAIDILVDELSLVLSTEGEFNYIITKLLHLYVEQRGIRYNTLNSAQGIIECVGKEFYRTVVSPYEDIKKKENGAISSLDK